MFVVFTKALIKVEFQIYPRKAKKARILTLVARHSLCIQTRSVLLPSIKRFKREGEKIKFLSSLSKR